MGAFLSLEERDAQAGLLEGDVLELVEELSLLSRAEPVDWVIDDAGEIVVATSTGTFTSRATGQTLTTPVVEHFWVTDGQIHRIDAYYKDPKSLAPLFDGAAE